MTDSSSEIPPKVKFRAKIASTNIKYQKYYSPLFFVAGFLFDIVTLSRVDDWFSILQQAAYLFIIIQILKYRTYEVGKIWSPPERFAKIWHYNDEALHFILGSLLSVYALFYFVSSSLATSFIFISIIFALLVANELPSLQKRGLTLKYALLSLCVFSFLFIIVPTTLGFIGLIPFIVSLTIGLALPFALFKTLQTKNLVDLDLKKTVLTPPVAIATILFVLYVFKLLPPIPLSIQYIGVYHNVEKIRPADNSNGDTKFLLKYDRAIWKFWQNGDQDFSAEPGDKIYCFVRIFAPINFKDKVVFHWLKYENSEWQSRDKITNDIVGGRNHGFRGFAVKSNYEPGLWRVQVETTDGREIGRIGFEVTLAEHTNLAREFKIKEY